MTEQTVTVETNQMEEDTVLFCDACGDPVGELDDREYETLYRNPKATTPQLAHDIDSRLHNIAESLAQKSHRGRIETKPVKSFGSNQPVATELHGIERELRKLKDLFQKRSSLSHDGSVDVCHKCLEERFSGPEVTSFETLELEDDETNEPSPLISFELHWSSVYVLAGLVSRLTAIAAPFVALALLLFGMNGPIINLVITFVVACIIVVLTPDF